MGFFSDVGDFFQDNPLVSGVVTSGASSIVSGPLNDLIGGFGEDKFTPGEPNIITQPDAPELNLPTRRETGPAPTAPEFVKAPGITAPPSLTQTQQQVRGDTLTRIVKDARQLESTTGRAVTGEQIGQVAEGLFGAAADRAAQNKALALQEFETVNRLELQRFGLDSKNILNQAQIKLQAHQFNVNTALNEFAQDLQASGMELDQAFRIAQQSIDVQVQNESNRIQREAIEAGISINQANARAQGMSTLIQLGMTAAILSAREFKDNIIPFSDDEHELNLDRVMEMPLYHFQYKGDKQHRMGGMVDEAPADILHGDNMIDLYSMNAMLMSAVKALTERVKQLEPGVK